MISNLVPLIAKPMKIRLIPIKIRKNLIQYRKKLDLRRDLIIAKFRKADVSIFHNFSPSPTGGGHQFLRALLREMKQHGIRIENNMISSTTRACLFNSFNFDFERLRRFKRYGCRMVHRVDGPIVTYRGYDDGTDQQIRQINRELADATIFQSHYSMQKHIELGLNLKSPRVILNACDPTIFNSKGKIPFCRQRKIRLISTSWSDNRNKGADVYKWLDDHLDWSLFEYTFVGRSPIGFHNINIVNPVPSQQVAELLKQHDIYIIASKNDPCSNSLIEALFCSLPAIFFKSGGHAEIIGNAGLGFDSKEEIPGLLDQLIDEYGMRKSSVSLPTLSQVANSYLKVMGLIEQ